MSEKDDFWELDKLLPPKKRPPVTPDGMSRRFSTEEVLAMVTDEKFSSCPTENAQNRLTFSSDRAKTEQSAPDDFSYCPEGNKLIRRITVKHYRDRYDFYDSFRKAALLYYDVPGVKCDFVSFYSYMPQYSQMNREQRAYYFYWRSEIREGRYPKTDYSYLYLYVYEILNLPDKIDKEQGIDLLCTLWGMYRKALPGIDKYMSVWVQDYCMVYRLPSPIDRIRSFIFPVISMSGFKEFYLSDLDAACSDGITAMTAYLSDYDWRNGKFATGESREAYRMHMTEAMKPLLREIMSSADRIADRASVIVRDAFPHSLCTHTVKCRLEIEYYPLAQAADLRAAVTMAIKYTENRLRAALGVKSRLSVRDFPDEYKKVIDAYFDRVFEEKNREKRLANVPAYEKMYDVPHEKLSFVGADEIERASWDTTFRLVDKEEAEQIRAETEAFLSRRNEQNSPLPTPEATIMQESAETHGLDKNAVRFLQHVSEEDQAAVQAFLSNGGEDADLLADRINEFFAEQFGDIVLEPSENGYRLIEDYREDMNEWLRNLTP